MHIKNRFPIALTILFVAGLLLFNFSVTTVPVQAADQRFLLLKDGTVQDKKSGLNWAAKDNGSDITWAKAESYCKNYSAGGHKNWRMPTASELSTLYGNSKKTTGKDYSGSVDIITSSISITAPYVWSSEKRTSNKSITFGFNYGTIKRLYRADGKNRRALPVR